MDGSRVLSHFPPGDSYHMQGQVKEVSDLYLAAGISLVKYKSVLGGVGLEKRANGEFVG